MEVDGARPARVIVTAAGGEVVLPEADSPAMLVRLSGIVADLAGREAARVALCEPRSPARGDPEGATPVAVLHLVGRAVGAGGPTVRRIEVLRRADGRVVALDRAMTPPPCYELDRESFIEVGLNWPGYEGGFDDAARDGAGPRGEEFVLPRPYVPSPFFLDVPTLEARLAGGHRTNLTASTRDLSETTMRVRLPRDYDPRSPAGLLVWVSPTPSGGIPPMFVPALDELGLIAIGADDAGNARYAPDRDQLALDMAATAMRRFHIDPRRVYITGMSGGGRISSIVQGCFPDVFMGCVPIVGLEAFRPVPNGLGQFFRPGYERPAPALMRLLKLRRIAPMTGPPDGNYVSVTNGGALLAREGLAVRVFEYPDMGHVMPTPERFREAIAWVDEPWQQTRAREVAAAAEAWARYESMRGSATAIARRRMLMAVVGAGPWTEHAWRAIAELEG